jgi:hypothetical protein
VTAADAGVGGRADTSPELEDGEWPAAVVGLEMAVLNACAAETEWPAQIAAGICAGVDFAIANPTAIQGLIVNDATVAADSKAVYEHVIRRLVGFVQSKAPREARLPGSTDEALVAGIVGLVGDHIRVGRQDRLAELRPELVLLALLPYLGFSEAQRWANRIDGEWKGKS